MNNTKKDYNKILGCLVGGAAGDALGYAVEFIREGEIFKRYGKQGICEYDLDDGKAIISDDTQMTLFTGAGILLADEPMNYTSFITGIYDAYQEWLETQESGKYNAFQALFGAADTSVKKKAAKTWLRDIPFLNYRRAPGNTCLSALRTKKLCGVYDPLNSSKGCGGVMRVAPVGLFYDTDFLTIEEIDRRGAGAAALTHGHPLGFLPAAGLVHIVQMVSHQPEISLWEAVEDMIRVVPNLYEEFEGHNQIFARLMQKAYDLAKLDVQDLDAIHTLGEGWVGDEALAIAIYCALKHENDFDAAICAAVNHNGDSDSTGAIAGNILGAKLGFDAIPEKFKQNLEGMEVYIRMSEELADICSY